MKELLLNFCLPGHRDVHGTSSPAASPRREGEGQATARPRTAGDGLGGSPGKDAAATRNDDQHDRAAARERRRQRETEARLQRHFPTPRFLSDLVGLHTLSSTGANLGVQLGVDPTTHVKRNDLPRHLYVAHNSWVAAVAYCCASHRVAAFSPPGTRNGRQVKAATMTLLLLRVRVAAHPERRASMARTKGRPTKS